MLFRSPPSSPGPICVTPPASRSILWRQRPSGALRWLTAREVPRFRLIQTEKAMTAADTSPRAAGDCNDSAVRSNHCDHLILKETQHGPIHRRLPVWQRPICGIGTSIPGRALSLSRLPQASWGPFSRFRDLPAGCGDDRWRNTRKRRAVFLPRCGSSIFARSADEIEVNLGSLDAPDQLIPTYESWIVRRESWLPPFPQIGRAHV